MAGQFTTLEIFFSAEGLHTRDRFSEADGFVVFHLNGQQLARTEVVQNSPDPQWVTPINIDYKFEEVQDVRVEVFDDNQNRPPTLIGCATFTISSLVTAENMTLAPRLTTDRNTEVGTLRVRASEFASCADTANFQLHAKRLDNVDGFMGRSDPFIIISRQNPDNSFTAVYRSEYRKNNLSPLFKRASINMQQLCFGNPSTVLRFEIWDYEKNGNHKLIGNFCTDVNVLMTAVGQEFPVINEAKRRSKRNYQNSGTVLLVEFGIEHRPTMLDYIKGGCEIDLAVAIDFSAANGDLSNGNSLHTLSTSSQNPYEQAINLIGRVLQDYDQDNLYNVSGAAAMINGVVRHEFSLIVEGRQVQGIEGILAAYRHAVPQLRFAGPMMFAPLINKAADAAAEFTSQFPQKYTIHLLLTAGEIGDMQDTIDAVVRASSLPMSIVIVGIGNGNFENLDVLDANEAPLTSSSGTSAQRDCVHSVIMRDFFNNSAGLGRELLKALPDQFLAYYLLAGTPPNPPVGSSGTMMSQSNMVLAEASNQARDGKDLFANAMMPS